MKEFDAVTRLLQGAVQTGLIPGFVACAGIGDDVLYFNHGGYAQVHGGARAMQPNTLFDVASLTKVMATLPAIILLFAQRRLSPDAPVSHYCDQFAEGIKKKVNVGHLLSHTAGLMTPKPHLWQQVSSKQAIVEAALSQPIYSEPGSTVHYSDVGYIILGEIIHRVTGIPLEVWTREQIFIPHGMYETGYLPTRAENIAATEVREQGVVVGVVHDRTAQVMDGVAGHAGLFSTASDIARYLMVWTGVSKFLARKWMDQMVVPRTTGTTGNRSWGWVLQGDSQDISGMGWPRSVASHTGFTGVSVLFDRPSRVWACLLTNRIHFGRHVAIGPLRQAYHTALAKTFYG